MAEAQGGRSQASTRTPHRHVSWSRTTAVNRRRQQTPVTDFGGELVTEPQPRERVELRPQVLLARSPLAGEGAFLLEFVEGGVEGAIADLENVRRGLEALTDSPAVEGLEGDDLEMSR